MVLAEQISRLVGSFLRVVLIPLILIGIPCWPLLGLLCIVPIIGIVTIPLFLLLTVLLLYSVAWFSYLMLAQADPPASAKNGAIAPFIPFLPYSPLRCLKVNWAAAIYAISAINVAIPAILDWSYRRVMVLGQRGGGIVKENISYGSPYPGKRLDIYLPGIPHSAYNAGVDGGRSRKHSTVFAEPAASSLPGENDYKGLGESSTSKLIKKPVVVFVPSPIPPLTWTNRRKTYLQLALKLRRQGYCVVIPDVTFYPEARVDASVVDLRLVLRWVADNCEQYGGDPRRIHLLGHGMSAHLAMLTLTQEAVVLSREGHLQREHQREAAREKMMRWDDSTTEDESRDVNGGGIPHTNGTKPRKIRSLNEETAWVDEAMEDSMPPGLVMSGSNQLPTSFLQSAEMTTGRSQDGTQTNGNSAVPFPSFNTNTTSRVALTSSGGKTNESGISAISNGLRRVEIYEPEIELPPIAGVILLAGVFDVIKCFRGESDRGVEHLSVLRRSCGPSHTSCLLHSPAHLLYAAKNILDVSLLPPKFLLIHGGKDAVVDISQSTLLKTLLSGVGVDSVKLRAYRELGHAEAVASLCLGMGKSSTRYSKQILNDIGDFIAT